MRLWQRVRSLAAVKITAVTPIAVTYPLERETMSFAFVRTCRSRSLTAKKRWFGSVQAGSTAAS